MTAASEIVAPPLLTGNQSGDAEGGGPRALLVYDNIGGTYYWCDAANRTFADDLTLDPYQPTPRLLTSYVVEMYASATTPAYTLTTQLYTATGWEGDWDVGVPIPGTQWMFNVPAGGTQPVVLTAGPFTGPCLPNTVWMVYQMTIAQGPWTVGPMIGEHAELPWPPPEGTDNYFAIWEGTGWGRYRFGGYPFPAGSYAGFRAKVYANPCSAVGACCYVEGGVMQCTDTNLTPGLTQATCENSSLEYPAGRCGKWYYNQLCPATTCGDPCVVTCTPNEGEPICGPDYEDYYNGGCNSDAPIFQPINPGQTICGTSGVFEYYGWELYRDTDWYVLVITNPGYTNINWTVRAEFPVRIFVFADGSTGSCDEAADYYGFMRDGDPCADVAIDWCVTTGTYWLVVMPQDWDFCHTCGQKYTATVTCTPGCTPEMTEDTQPSQAEITVELTAGSHQGIYTIPFSTQYDYDGTPCELGSTVIERYGPPYQTGLNIATEIMTLDMTGLSGLGDIKFNLAATPSTGMVQNVVANAAQDNIIGGDSFFDVWFEINVPDYGVLHNFTAVRVAAEIATLPPVGAHYIWPPPLMGDLNNDGVVNGKDIQCFVNCALTPPPPPVPGCNCPAGDFSGNGSVGAEDISAFVAALLAGGGVNPIELRNASNQLVGYLRGVDHWLWEVGGYCPPDATFSQAPNDVWAGTSDAGAGVAHSENFWPAFGEVCDLHWWGINYICTSDWIPCVKNDERFRIEVYNNIVVDGVKQPGTERLCGPYVVTPSKRDTCQDWGQGPIYFYETDLSPCCELSEPQAWVTIQGLDDGQNCWFLWHGSLDGDSHSWVAGGWAWAHDLSLCVTGTQEETVGACCNLDTQVCDDNVNAEDCLGVTQQFHANTACADLNPPCGGGACCNPLGECVLVLSQAECDYVHSGHYYPGVPCPDPEHPEIPDPCHGSCCLDNNPNDGVIDGCVEGLTLDECWAMPGHVPGEPWHQSQTCAACQVACCYYVPTQCLYQYEEDCNDAGGQPGPLGVACADTGCNKDCATATLITSLPYTDFGGNAGTGDDYQFICGGEFESLGPDVVYRYVCTSAIDVSISLCAPDPGPYTDFDTVLYVYEDNCNLDPDVDVVACNEDACDLPNSPLASAIDCVHFRAGHTYYIIVDGYDATSIGHYYLHVEQTTFTPAAAADTCPTGSLFDQHLTSDYGTANVSDTRASGTADDYLVYDNFWRPNSTTFTDMTFWGVTAYTSGGGWTSCTENPMTFQIKFWTDNNGAPGTNLYTYSNVSLTGVDTGLDFGGWPIYEYTVTTLNVAGLANGWVSIQGISAPATCWFMWVDTFTNCGPLAFLKEGTATAEPVIFDFAFCLSP